MFLLPPPETLIKPSALIWTRSSSSVDFHQNVGVKTSWPERRTPCLLFQYHGAEKKPLQYLHRVTRPSLVSVQLKPEIQVKSCRLQFSHCCWTSAESCFWLSLIYF